MKIVVAVLGLFAAFCAVDAQLQGYGVPQYSGMSAGYSPVGYPTPGYATGYPTTVYPVYGYNPQIGLGTHENSNANSNSNVNNNADSGLGRWY